MTILIEISKSWKEDKWNMRIGDIAGCTEVSNFSKKEILEEIKSQFKIEEELEKKK